MQQKDLPSATNLRLAEFVAALSLATDLGMGQPMEYVVNKVTSEQIFR